MLDPISRRTLITRGLSAGGVLLAGGLLAACGSDGGPATSAASSDAASGTPKRGGRLQLGIVDGDRSGTLDAHKPLGLAAIIRGFALYSKPWVWDANMQPAAALAEETEVDATARRWTIRLRDGAEFHNGKTVGADDLIFSIRRLISPELASPWASLLYSVDPKRIRKLDERTVRLELKTGFQPFQYAFTNFGGVVPTEYDPRKPIGAGPFKLQSFTPGQRSVFVRHENYWEDGKPYADELEIIEFPDDAARLNALQSGQVNLLTGVSPDQVALVQAAKGARTVVSKTDNWVALGLNTAAKPFDDVRVRQAFRLAADRPELVAKGLGGQGRPGNDLYTPNDPTFARSIPQREHDPEQARALLKAAGHERLAVTLTTSPNDGGAKAALIFAQQAKQAGIDVTVKKVDAATFNGPRYLDWPLATFDMVANSYLSTALQTDAPISTRNTTHFDDPRFATLFKRAIQQPDEAKRRPLVEEMQQIQHDRGGLLLYAFNDNVDAVAGNVQGAVPERTQFSVWRFEKLWLS